MFDIFITLFKGIWGVLKVPLLVLAVVLAVFFFAVVFYAVYFRFKGYRFKKGFHVSLKKEGVLRRLFISLPKQYVLDMYEREPDFFPYQGLIIYTGRQGYGKTISMVRDLMRIQKEYPLCKVITNLAYRGENRALKHWKQLIEYKNGIHGVVVAMDELQNWFSSNQSKNFPPQMLEVITQNRKNRRVIMGTAQNFYLLSKAIRSQCTEVRECFTLFGCLTIVRRREPYLDAEGNVSEWKNRGIYFYVHDIELRESYDTYRVIKSLSDSGFAEQKEIVVEVNAKA